MKTVFSKIIKKKFFNSLLFCNTVSSQLYFRNQAHSLKSHSRNLLCCSSINFSPLRHFSSKKFSEDTSQNEQVEDLSRKQDSFHQKAQDNLPALVIQKELNFSINYSTFLDVRLFSDTLLDKSLYIKDLIRCPNQTILITRPKRFGKSFNFNMAGTFFQLNLNDNGEIDQQKYDEMIKLFKGGEMNHEQQLFVLQPLKIDNQKDRLGRDIIGTYFGKFPVINLDLKGIYGDTHEEIVAHLITKISQAFKQHEYLHSKLSDAVQEKFNNYLTEKINTAQLIESLLFLSELLFKYWNKQVIILVDEYDNLPNNLLENTQNKEQQDFFKKVCKLMSSMLSQGGKGNQYLYKMIMTGISDSLNKQGSSGFNNVRVFGIGESEYFSESFGYYEADITDQLSKMIKGQETKDKVIQLMRQYYNGYNIGGKTFYNIWSCFNYLSSIQDKESLIVPQMYWANNGNHAILQKLLLKGLNESLNNKFTQLLQQEEVILKHDPQINLFDYNLVGIENNEELITYLLYSQGYITKVADKEGYFKIPNLEVQQDFQKILKRFFESYPQLEISDEFINSLLKADEQGLQESIQDYILRVSSVKDFPNEKAFQNFIIGLLYKLDKMYDIKSEEPAGYGFADIIMKPRYILDNRNLYGFALELKRIEKNPGESKKKIDKKLEEQVNNALQQIKETDYITRLNDCENVVLIGMVICGKRLMLKIEKLPQKNQKLL